MTNLPRSLALLQDALNALAEADLMLALTMEARNGERQDLRLKRLQPHKQHPTIKVTRRATRDMHSKRERNPAGYNANQRDRYKKTRTATRADGTKGTIKAHPKFLGSAIAPKRKLRSRLR